MNKNSASRARFSIITPSTETELAQCKSLFQQYATWLNVSLCFQNFDQEMAEFPDHYGALLLAKHGDTPAGAVALKRLDTWVCEMKRLYCPDAHRGLGIGRALAIEIVDTAKRMGFERMRLDTLTRLTAAIALYESLGFYEIPAYYENPLGEVIYLELNLTNWDNKDDDN